MKIKQIVAITALIVTMGGAALWSAPPDVVGSGAPRMMPLNSDAFRTTRPELYHTSVQWVLGGVVNPPWKLGRVQFVGSGWEYAGGSFTPDDPALFRGEAEYTLKPGTPIFEDILSWYGERYEGYPTVPDDPPMSDALFLECSHIVVTIDGKTIISDENKVDFYLPETPLDPIVEYPAPTPYGSVAAAYIQGVSLLSPPLPPGRHVIHSYFAFILPAGSYSSTSVPAGGMGYCVDITVTITISPH
jgi:hypothetical protein